MCSIIPVAWNIHTVMLSLLCSNMNRSFMALWLCHITVLCKPLFTYIILPSRLANGILFIKQYFQIKIINNLQHVQNNTRGNKIPSNIQACKCLTGTVAYKWQCCWCWRILSGLKEYSRVLHNVCVTHKVTQCVTCKVYWNVNGSTNPLFTEYTRNFI